jgi:flagellar secretion chaperone FliS
VNFVPRGQFAARARYRNVDLSSRIEGANPHQLVVIMFDEALKALDAMILAAERGDYAQRAARQARVLAIVHGLESSLDYDKGGEIARGLAAIYREARRLVGVGGRDGTVAPLTEARRMLSEIADAWGAIGRVPA